MTPFNKATRLISSMIKFQPKNKDGSFQRNDAFDIAKNCALECVDEVIENVTDTEIIMYEMGGDYYSRLRKSYFQEVKQEIEKL